MGRVTVAVGIVAALQTVIQAGVKLQTEAAAEGKGRRPLIELGVRAAALGHVDGRPDAAVKHRVRVLTLALGKDHGAAGIDRIGIGLGDLNRRVGDARGVVPEVILNGIRQAVAVLIAARIGTVKPGGQTGVDEALPVCLGAEGLVKKLTAAGLGVGITRLFGNLDPKDLRTIGTGNDRLGLIRGDGIDRAEHVGHRIGCALAEVGGNELERASRQIRGMEGINNRIAQTGSVGVIDGDRGDDIAFRIVAVVTPAGIKIEDLLGILMDQHVGRAVDECPAGPRHAGLDGIAVLVNQVVPLAGPVSQESRQIGIQRTGVVVKATETGGLGDAAGDPVGKERGRLQADRAQRAFAPEREIPLALVQGARIGDAGDDGTADGEVGTDADDPLRGGDPLAAEVAVDLAGGGIEGRVAAAKAGGIVVHRALKGEAAGDGTGGAVIAVDRIACGPPHGRKAVILGTGTGEGRGNHVAAVFTEGIENPAVGHAVAVVIAE